MKNCLQTPTQSVYQHGLSVRDHIFELISFLKTNQISNDWRLPNWMHKHRQNLLNSLLPEEIIEEYTIFHDCSKPYCLIIDEQGKRHFPNHAELSSQIWMNIGGNKQVAELMRMDMIVHTMKAKDIAEFIKHPEASTLLLAALAEVHSNAKMFGGLDSESFKIKWNQINKRGNMVCQKLWR